MELTASLTRQAVPCFRLSQRARPTAACTLPANATFGARRIPARSPLRVTAATDTETDLTGEWPANWSLASYEDVGEFFKNNLFKDDTAPDSLLSDVMSQELTTTTADATLDSIKDLFKTVTGVPVVKSATDLTLVGVISRKDLEKSGKTVEDVMSFPPVAARPTAKVADAAALMLKHKVHRIPIVDNNAKVVGIVTRTDIFNALSHEM